jgi:phage tail sheath protein FI
MIVTSGQRTQGKAKLKTKQKPITQYMRLSSSSGTFLHGVETVEVTTGASTISEVASCVIGIVGTAEIAPAGELVVVRNADDVASKLGAGTIATALNRIYKNYLASNTAICLPLGKDSDFSGNAVPAPSGVSGTTADVMLYSDSAITSPQWLINNPNDLPVTFAADDETVFTVDSDGNLTPVATGSGTLTITVDGGDSYTSDVLTVNVTVADDADIPADLMPSGAYFSAGATSMLVAQPGSPVVLTNPDDQTVAWSVDDASIATVDTLTGEITPLGAGSTTLTASLAATDTVMAVDVTCTLTVAASPANPLLAAFISGLSTFRKARQLFGASPKIMLAPGIMSLEGAQGPANSLGNQIRAVWFGDLPQGIESVEEAYAWKNSNCVYSRIFVDWPRVAVITEDGSTAYDEVAPSMIGLCCQLDKNLTGLGYETGYWFSPSNIVLPDVVGVEKVLDYLPNDPDSEVNYLNSQGIATVINQLGGWRAFGNRSTVFPGTNDPTSMIMWRRVCDIIEDSVEYYTLQYLDRPMFTRPTDISSSLIGIIQDAVNTFLRSKIGTALVYGECFIYSDENTAETLQAGTIKYHYKITPPIPAEHISYTSEVYIAGLEDAFRKLTGS